MSIIPHNDSRLSSLSDLMFNLVSVLEKLPVCLVVSLASEFLRVVSASRLGLEGRAGLLGAELLNDVGPHTTDIVYTDNLGYITNVTLNGKSFTVAIDTARYGDHGLKPPKW